MVRKAGGYTYVTNVRFITSPDLPPFRSIMTLDEYQEFTKTTSLYGNSIDPLFLGLCEEAGEVAGKRKKFHRGDFDQTWYEGKPIEENLYLNALKKELGDVMWYVSEICNAHGLTIQEVIEGNVAKLTDRKERGVIAGSGDQR
jgi:NTP pyrophosphatase (non-canonical NTP hydrolase)